MPRDHVDEHRHEHGRVADKVAYHLRELSYGAEYLVDVEEDAQVLEQADQHAEEEAEDRAAHGGSEEEGEEARHELANEVGEAAAGGLLHYVAGEVVGLDLVVIINHCGQVRCQYALLRPFSLTTSISAGLEVPEEPWYRAVPSRIGENTAVKTRADDTLGWVPQHGSSGVGILSSVHRALQLPG